MIKRKLLSCCIIFSMLLVPFSNVRAEEEYKYVDEVVNTNDGEWEVKGQRKVFGLGIGEDDSELPILSLDNMVLNKYIGTSDEIIIPSKVMIGGSPYLLDVSNTLESNVFDGSSVKTIELSRETDALTNSFSGSLINQIKCESNLINIEAGAFMDYDGSSLAFRDGNVHFHTGAFSNCESLETLFVSGTVEFDEGCFLNCPNLRSIIFDYNTKVKNIKVFSSASLGVEDVRLQVYGKNDVWNNNENIAYEVERLDPYISVASVSKLYKGDSFDLNAEMFNDDMTSISYVSSNNKVVSVDKDGFIRAKGVGSCNINVVVATLDSVYTEVVKLTVCNIINKNSVKLRKGKTYSIKPSLSGIKIKYSTSKKSVCSVSSKGVVKAKKKGTATVTIKSENGGVHKLKVKVIK